MDFKKNFLNIILIGVSVLIVIGFASSFLSGSKNNTQSNSKTTTALDVAPGMSDKELNISLSRMIKKFDEVKQITFYRHTHTPQYVNDWTSVDLTFSVDKTPYIPNLSFKFVSNDWLFIDAITIKTDKNTYNKDKIEIERDSGTRSSGEVGIWEWASYKVDEDELRMLLDMISSKKTIIRFNGSKYYHDYVLTENNKLAIRDSLASWKKLGGTL